MRDFWEYDRYKDRTSEETTAPIVQYYTRDFLDWYHDTLRYAPKLPHKEWMTAFSACGHRKFRLAAARGIGAYLRANDRFPNFRHAKSFSEMNLLNSIILPMPVGVPADKLLVGDYIPDAMRSKVRTAKVAAVFRKAEELTFEGLEPGRYFLKANHGSQTNMAIDLRPGAASLDLEAIREKAGKWLAKGYGENSSQWWYNLIERRLFIEEDLREEGSDDPIEDLRFHCINGQVAMLQLDVEGGDTRDNPIYDADLNYLPYDLFRKNQREAPLPRAAETARDVAQALCKRFQYVRVDLYIRGDEIFLGELTILPNSGRRQVRSPALNEILCSFWDPMPKVVDITVP